MNAALLIAALTVAPGSPAERPVADFSADCFLGHWEGHESRLVLEHGAEVPFFVGRPGEGLAPSGTVELRAGARARGDVTASQVREFRATEACEVLDGDAPVTIEAGETFSVGECDAEQTCETWHGGRLLMALDGGCEGTEVPAAPDPEAGWWVPTVREGVAGWVRGEQAGYAVEVRCVGPDDGADLSLALWHAPAL